MKKAHIIPRDDETVLPGLTINALKQQHSGAWLLAGGVPMQGMHCAWQGEVIHVEASKHVGISCVGLDSCSGVFYAYFSGSVLTDVVAFHAPIGFPHVTTRNKAATQNASFGDPSAEAKLYNIVGYTECCAVVALGPKWADENVSSSAELVKHALSKQLRAVIKKADSVIVYGPLMFHAFGMSPDQYWGEPGQPSSRSRASKPEDQQSLISENRPRAAKQRLCTCIIL